MGLREVHDLRNFGFRNFVGVDATFPNTIVMDVKHDLRRLFGVLVKEALQYMYDEFHRCKVVIQK